MSLHEHLGVGHAVAGEQIQQTQMLADMAAHALMVGAGAASEQSADRIYALQGVQRHDDPEVHGVDAHRGDDGQERRRDYQEDCGGLHEAAEEQEQHVDDGEHRAGPLPAAP